MSIRAKVFVAFVILVGLINLAMVLPSFVPDDLLNFATYLLLALLAAGLKLHLPGVTGTISVGFFFVLIGIVSLSLPQVLITGCLAVLVQYFWHARLRLRTVQVLFNVATTSIAISCSYYVSHSAWMGKLPLEWPVVLAIVACTYFFTTTLPVATAIALTEAKRIRDVWCSSYLWVFPYYLAGAATAGLVEISRRYLGWQSSMLVMPAIYLVYRSYRTYLGRLEDATVHAEESAALHLRTIESLALAIEAKDHTTHEHLQRVQIYALEIGKELKLSDKELQGLRTASILHDIGKIAVPEQILCKPGKLTPEEFQKIKIHPVVGAEILARAQFPYPVVPIVRSHHEKWDGSGYPDGLKGEEIPIGARILAVVDCLDALASDRQYRRALPLEKAMEMVAEQADKAFDSKIVDILRKRYVELECLAKASPAEQFHLSTDVEVVRGAAPDAGFEKADGSRRLTVEKVGGDQLRGMIEMLESRMAILPGAEIFSLAADYISQAVPYDCCVVYARDASVLTPAYTCGAHHEQLASLRISVGQGLSGWVQAHGKAIINGNPSVDCAGIDCRQDGVRLKSALAIPLNSEEGVNGVLTLFRQDADAFNQADLRILSTVDFALGRLLKTVTHDALRPPERVPALVWSGPPQSKISARQPDVPLVHKRAV